MIATRPNPPICIRSKITTLPKKLHEVAVVTVTSPVTQTAEVAVNKQSRNEIELAAFAWDMGSFNKMAPNRIMNKKLSVTVWDGVIAELIFFSKTLFLALSL